MPRNPFRRRRPFSYLASMERELGPLIWPSDHNHGRLPLGYGGPVAGCSACVTIHTHHAGCGCGHCPDLADPRHLLPRDLLPENTEK